MKRLYPYFALFYLLLQFNNSAIGQNCTNCDYLNYSWIPSKAERYGYYGYLDTLGNWYLPPARISRQEARDQADFKLTKNIWIEAYMFTQQGWAIIRDGSDSLYYYIGYNGQRKLKGQGFLDARACYGASLFVTTTDGESRCLDTTGAILKELGRMRLSKACSTIMQVTDPDDQKTYFLDMQGNRLFSQGYYDCSIFINGHAAVFESPRIERLEQPDLGSEAMFDEYGEFFTGPVFYYKFLTGWRYHTQTPLKYDPDNDGGIVNRSGTFALKGYKAISAVTPEGWLAVTRGNKNAVIDTNGKLVVPWSNQLIRLNPYQRNPVIAVGNGTDWYLIHPDGKRVWGSEINASDSYPLTNNRLLYLGGRFFACHSANNNDNVLQVRDTAGGVARIWKRLPDGKHSVFDTCYIFPSSLSGPLGRLLVYRYDERQGIKGIYMVDIKNGEILWAAEASKAMNLLPDPGRTSHYRRKADLYDAFFHIWLRIYDFFRAIWELLFQGKKVGG